MNELQGKILELLKAFIEVCDKHGLMYYLKGGSTLGAIRHKGFIPWDDDADVMMPREDYEKFCKLQAEFDDKGYFIQTPKTDKHYFYGFAKLRDNNTTLIETPFALIRMNHGIWLDIFPLDGFDLKKEFRPKKYSLKMKYIWAEMFGGCYLYAFRRKIHWRTFFQDVGLNILAYLFFWTNVFNYRVKWIEHVAKSIPYDDANWVGSYFSYYFKHEAFPKEFLGEGVFVEFEGVKCRVPEKWDEYLTLVYGDYMTPPPENKRKTAHFTGGMSFTVGYKEFIKNKKKYLKKEAK